MFRAIFNGPSSDQTIFDISVKTISAERPIALEVIITARNYVFLRGSLLSAGRRIN
jgi:hypothetical protein